MKLFATLIISMLCCNALWCQNTFTVSGQIQDENGAPMPGASILYQNNSSGTTADARGNFTLPITNFPAYLEVSFIGYKTYYFIINEADFNKQKSIVRNVKLSVQKAQLETVTVVGKAFEDFFIHPGFSVLDFTFVNEHILLLLKNKQTHKLVLMNSAQDSLAQLVLTQNSEGLTTDCLNQHYMLTKDSVFALSFANGQIQIIGALNAAFYNQSITPCIASNTHALYYNFYKYNNQLLEIYQSSKNGGASKKIKQLVDYEDAASINEYGQLAQQLLEENGPMTSSLVQMDRFKDGFERMAWFKHTMATPIYNPLFASADGALLFNHLQDSVQRLNLEGAVVQSFHIHYHHLADFKKLILKDAFSSNYYAVFAKGGQHRLGLLSNVDFSIEKEISIKNHDFPTSLKVRNGVVYFLDRDDGDFSRFKLYRKKL